MIDKFLNSNTTEMRLARTVVQGLIAVLIGNIAMIVGQMNLTPETASAVTAVIMCFLSPIMSLLKQTEKIEDDQ